MATDAAATLSCGKLVVIDGPILAALSAGLLCTAACLLFTLPWEAWGRRLHDRFLNDKALVSVAEEMLVHGSVLAPTVYHWIDHCEDSATAWAIAVVWVLVSLIVAVNCAHVLHPAAPPALPAPGAWRGLWRRYTTGPALSVLQGVFVQLSFVIPAAFLYWERLDSLGLKLPVALTFFAVGVQGAVICARQRTRGHAGGGVRASGVAVPPGVS